MADVYDFYGMILLEDKPLSVDDRATYDTLMRDIRRKFVTALKSRIIAEAGYIGIDLKVMSIEAMCKKISDTLAEAVTKEADTMAALGTGFKLMNFIENVHNNKPPDPFYTAPDAFRSKEGTKRAMFGGEPWAKISEAFIKVEKAQTTKEIIYAIDITCDLQHNTNHVLFDITGGDVKAILDQKDKPDAFKYFYERMSAISKPLATKYLMAKDPIGKIDFVS